MKVSERLLLEKILQQDRSAMEILYTRHEKLLFTIAMKITEDRIKTERLLKSVFHDVWKNPLLFLNTKERHLSVCLIKHLKCKHTDCLKAKIC